MLRSCVSGPVAQWIRHLIPIQGIPGSNSGRVEYFCFSQKCTRNSNPIACNSKNIQAMTWKLEKANTNKVSKEKPKGEPHRVTAYSQCPHVNKTFQLPHAFHRRKPFGGVTFGQESCCCCLLFLNCLVALLCFLLTTILYLILYPYLGQIL